MTGKKLHLIVICISLLISNSLFLDDCSLLPNSEENSWLSDREHNKKWDAERRGNTWLPISTRDFRLNRKVNSQYCTLPSTCYLTDQKANWWGKQLKSMNSGRWAYEQVEGIWFLQETEESTQAALVTLTLLLLLLLSRFSRVWLCATPETAAHQAPPSLGFSRQEHWSGLPFPSPMHESEKWNGSRSVVSDSSDPMDCSPPGSSVHGIFQARVLEWRAIAFPLPWHYRWHIFEAVAKVMSLLG